MNIQFSNWQLINLQDFDNAAFSVSAGVADTDATLSQLASQYIYFYDGNNSTAYGDWFPYELYATGTGFLGSNPVARYIQLSDIFSSEIYRLNGVVNAINSSGFTYITGGSFNSISHLTNGIIDYSIAGSFIYTPFGDIGGGTITSATINNSYGQLTFKGNLTIDANEMITSGNVTEFNYTSLTGEKFSISNTSFSYTVLRDLIGSAGGSTDFSIAYNYFLSSSSLNGNDNFTAGILNDILDGGAGVDRLNGGLGDDKYIVDLVQTGTTAATFRVALQDTVTEALNAGTNDILELRGNFDHLNATTLALGANLETLDASQTNLTKLNLTGNALNNSLIGNDAANILLDSTGNDTLNGGAGNDTLDGGIGVDSLIGGTGDDTYLVDIIATTTVAPAPIVVTGATLQDNIDETNGTTDGIDTLKLRGSVTIPAATLATNITLTGALANIENLDISLTGTTRLDLTGNDENNFLTGNAASNTLTGGFGNDTLDGGAGADSLIGGDGDDKYVIDSVADVIIDSSGNDTAEIRLTTGTYALSPTSDIENVILAGVAAINATGNAGNNTLTGNAAANILNGNGGTDTMIGGDGADTYIVDGSDTVIETNALAAGGIDLVKSSVTYTLTSNVENLTLTDGSLNGGTAAINATGNTLNNTLTGNAGANTLDGSAGIDILVGGLENDKYIVDLVQTGTTAATFRVALQDTVTEALNAGTNDILELRGNFDHLNATTLALGANLETLDASQTNLTKLNLTGNALNNSLIGNDAANILLDSTGNDTLNGGAGNDTLDGGIGVDSLIGGTGDDTYLVDIIATTTVAPAPIVVTGATLQDNIDETNGTTDGIDTLKLRGSVTIPAATLATNITLTGALANIENLDISLTGTTRLDLTGNDENNFLTGNAASNTLTGGFGNDTLDGGAGADSLIGGDGDDKYVIDSVADVIIDSSGNDTAEIRLTTGTYALSPTSDIENVILAGVAAINATGNAGNNTLTGNAAANILNGNGGTDTMIGGDGADTYIVDGSDTVIETNALAAGGIDLVKSSVTYTLTSNVENLTLTDGSLNGGTAAINATGNTLNNTLTGNAGANTLDGSAGIDILVGGLENDKYIVDLVQTGTTAATFRVALQDTVTEALNAGTNDILELRGNFDHLNATTLALGANLETLDASQTNLTKLNLTGNALNNSLIGNDAANILLDSTGNDTLNGGAGNDTLDGGIGVDSLIGGTGDDTYLVDIIATTTVAPAPIVVTGATLQDNIDETNGTTDGIDTLKLRGSVTIPAATLATNITLTGALANIENLDISLTGTTRLDLTGNDENNFLTGNAASNTLTGGFGNDTLDGGAGADSLIGGDGDDKYVIDSVADVIIDSSGNDTAEIRLTTGTYALSPTSDIENVILAGVAAINATGNAGNNTLTGNAAANILNGNGGTDTMIGGDGADTYIVDGSDTVIETNALAAGGIDLVKSSVTYTLTSNVENLTLTDGSLNGGTAAINATGNTLNNTLTGNAGANTLDGSAGIDILVGGLENDKYIVDLVQTGTTAATFRVALQDTVTEALNAGTNDILELRGNFDHLNATTLALGANLETLDASQTNLTKLNLTGNALNNSLIGNDAANILLDSTGNDTLNGGAGNDTLDGGIGVDSLIGGTGDDTYLVDIIATTTVAPAPIVVTGATLQDNIDETNGTTDGIDTLKLRGSVTIPAATLATNITLTGALANIENLDISLTGTTRLDLTGNDADNKLTGNAANNIINGGLGNDTLDGGAGNDIYITDNAGDIVTELLNAGIDTVQSSVTYSLFDTDGAGLNGGNVENLTLTGITNIDGTGNALANLLIGNDGNNQLIGLAGIDTLIGGLGIDLLIGGDGNDTYEVDETNDVVQEDSALAAGGVDIVRAKASFTLSANVENLTLIGLATNNINGSGNALNNIIIGDDGNNTLSGDAGSDSLTGGLGNDTLIGGLGIDTLIGGAGNDTFVFDTLLNAITNKDTIQGFNVAEDQILLDFTIFDTLGANLDAIEYRSGAGVTTAATANQHIIFNTTNGALYYDADGVGGQAAIQFATLTGTVGTLTNNSFSLGLNFNIVGTDQADTLNGTIGNDSIIGLAGNDTINGGAGADIMFGDLGNDVFYVDNVDDIVLEDYFYFNEINGYYDENGYTNTVYSSVSYTADFGIGNLTLTGTANINAYGSNYKSNIISGNSGDNILDGGVNTNPELDSIASTGTHIFLGNLDTLIGGAGNDTYIIRNAETVIELTGEGIDTYILSGEGGPFPVAFLIDPGSEIENFILANDNVLIDYMSGTNKDNLIVGNGLANNLYGLFGNDELKGLGGNDRLYGMVGNDILWGGAGNDTFVFESAGISTSDIVEDFVSGQDKIRVSDGTFFIPPLLSGIYTDMFVLGASAQDANDHFIYNKSSGDLFFDTDGNGVNVQQLIANFLPNSNLLQTDFVGALNTTQSGGLSIVGTNNSEQLNGGVGNDTISGGGGFDSINGNDGDDLLIGGSEADAIHGDNGNDTIYGGDFLDNLYGDAGDDVIYGEARMDNLYGGTGNDSLFGGDDVDSIDPGDGNDLVDGGEGNDGIFTSNGVDTLTGGGGGDRFILTSNSASSGVDVITDFASNVDVIMLRTNVFSVIGTLTGAFISGPDAVALDNNDYFIYDTSSGALYYDADANGAGVQEQLITLVGAPTLIEHDFLWL